MIRNKPFVLNKCVRPKVAFFKLTSCEGCQLQVFNRESGVLKFLNQMEIVDFREAITGTSSCYDVAFIEGSVNNEEQKMKLIEIRHRADTVVALGSCACFGGINQLVASCEKGISEADKGKISPSPKTPKALDEIIQVDVHIYGCPVKKKELESIFPRILSGKPVIHNKYPVCRECKQNHNICLLDLGEPCLGSVTRGGCDAWCTGSGMGCWGCRGPIPKVTQRQLERLSQRKGIDFDSLAERMSCFGGFSNLLCQQTEDLYKSCQL